MPLYSYLCKKCKHEFDFLVMDKEEKVECPKCKGTDLEKLFAPCSIGSSSKKSGPTMPPSCPSGGCGGRCGF